MSWLCKPGADGDGPGGPRRALERCSTRFVWHEGAEASELEVRRRNTKAKQKTKEGDESTGGGHDDSVLAGAEAPGGRPAD